MRLHTFPFLFLFIPHCLPMENNEISNSILDMKCQLNAAYQAGDVTSISNIYLEYNKKTITEDTFQQFKSNFRENSLHFYKWPNQENCKAVIGGWLFYPNFIEDWLDHLR